ncbi:hypothetical protein QIW31_06465 [Francisellaceae bacterium CB299]
MLKKRIKMAGMSIVEVILAVAMLLFVSYATLRVVSSGAISTGLLTKKVALVDQLSDRVSEYTILNSFDTTTSASTTFSESDITADIAPNNNAYTIYELLDCTLNVYFDSKMYLIRC